MNYGGKIYRALNRSFLLQQLRFVLRNGVNSFFLNLSIKVAFAGYTIDELILRECVGLAHNT